MFFLILRRIPVFQLSSFVNLYPKNQLKFVSGQRERTNRSYSATAPVKVSASPESNASVTAKRNLASRVEEKVVSAFE
jgi:hypothetical protein